MNLSNIEKGKVILKGQELLKVINKIPVIARGNNKFKFKDITKLDGAALRIDEPLVGIDVDDNQTAALLLQIFRYRKYNFLAYESQSRGMHFIFRSDKKLQSYKDKCYFGFRIEFYPGGFTRHFVVKDDDSHGRNIVEYNTLDNLSEIPEYMLSHNPDFKDLVGLPEEGRNNALMSLYGKMLQDVNVTSWDVFVAFITIVNEVLFDEPLPIKELKATILNAKKRNAFIERKALIAKTLKTKRLNKPEMVDLFLNNEKVIKYNGVVHIFDGEIYTPSVDAIHRRLLQINRLLTNNSRNEILEDIRLLTDEININHLDVYMIGAKNGIIDGSDKDGRIKFHNFSPRFTITKRLNVKIDPGYLRGQKESIYYKQIFGLITGGDKELENYLLDLIANAVIGHKNIYQVCTILLGSGENGKSTFLSLLQGFFGLENVSNLALSELGDRFSTEVLSRSMINVRDEVSAVVWGQARSFKEIVAGNRIKGERKFGNAFSFYPRTKFFLSANTLYQSKDKSKGFERRIAIIPCHNTFDGIKGIKNPILTDEFVQNVYGLKETLLAKLLPRIKKLAHTNVMTKQPPAVIRETQKYIYGDSSILLFLLNKIKLKYDDYLNMGSVRNNALPNLHKKNGNEFKTEYVYFCANVLDRPPYSERRIFNELQQLYGPRLIKKRIMIQNQREGVLGMVRRI